MYAGLSLGPFLGGFLTQSVRWRSVFIVGVAAGVMAALVTLQPKAGWAEAVGTLRLDSFSGLQGVYALVMLALSPLPDPPSGAWFRRGFRRGRFRRLGDRPLHPILNLGLPAAIAPSRFPALPR